MKIGPIHFNLVFEKCFSADAFHKYSLEFENFRKKNPADRQNMNLFYLMLIYSIPYFTPSFSFYNATCLL